MCTYLPLCVTYCARHSDAWLHFILTAISWQGHHYYHFIDEKTEAQRSLFPGLQNDYLCPHVGYLLKKMSCNGMKISEVPPPKVSSAGRGLGNLVLPVVDKTVKVLLTTDSAE